MENNPFSRPSFSGNPQYHQAMLQRGSTSSPVGGDDVALKLRRPWTSNSPTPLSGPDASFATTAPPTPTPQVSNPSSRRSSLLKSRSSTVSTPNASPMQNPGMSSSSFQGQNSPSKSTTMSAGRSDSNPGSMTPANPQAYMPSAPVFANRTATSQPGAAANVTQTSPRSYGTPASTVTPYKSPTTTPVVNRSSNTGNTSIPRSPLPTPSAKPKATKLPPNSILHRVPRFTSEDARALMWRCFWALALVGGYFGNYIHGLAQLAELVASKDVADWIPLAFSVAFMYMLFLIGISISRLYLAPINVTAADLPMTPREKLLMDRSGANSVRNSTQKPNPSPSPLSSLVSSTSKWAASIPLSNFKIAERSLPQTPFASPYQKPFCTPGATMNAGGQPNGPTPKSPLEETTYSSKISPWRYAGTPREITTVEELEEVFKKVSPPKQRQTPAFPTPQQTKSIGPQQHTPFWFTPPTSRDLNVPIYQHATPPKPVSSSTSDVKRERKVEGGFLALDPGSVNSELNIEAYLDGWAEKMRWWVAEKVVKPLVQRMDDIDQTLMEKGWEHLCCDKAVWTAGISISQAVAQTPNPAGTNTLGGGLFGGNNTFGGFGTSSSTFGKSKIGGTSGGGGFGVSGSAKPAFGTATTAPLPQVKPQGLFEMVQVLGGANDLVVERLKLEHYLDLGLEHIYARTRIVERIRSLSRGGGLSSFNWSSSGSSGASTPAKSLVTDSFVGDQADKGALGTLDASLFGKQQKINNDGHEDDDESVRHSSSNRGGYGGLVGSMADGLYGFLGGNSKANMRSGPTDSELVMHLVCRFLDEHMPSGSTAMLADSTRGNLGVSLSGGLGKSGTTAVGGLPGLSTTSAGGGLFGGSSSTAAKPLLGGSVFGATAKPAEKKIPPQIGGTGFSDRYLCRMESKLDSSRLIQIWQKTKGPPHYNVVYRNHIFEMYPKRNNLFNSLSVFAHLVSVTSGDHLGLLNLGGKAIGMIAAVSEGPMWSKFIESEKARERAFKSSMVAGKNDDRGTENR